MPLGNSGHSLKTANQREDESKEGLTSGPEADKMMTSGVDLFLMVVY